MNKKRVGAPRTIKKDYVKKLINPNTKETFYYVDQFVDGLKYF